jgi:hypothetical protein
MSKRSFWSKSPKKQSSQKLPDPPHHEVIPIPIMKPIPEEKEEPQIEKQIG